MNACIAHTQLNKCISDTKSKMITCSSVFHEQNCALKLSWYFFPCVYNQMYYLCITFVSSHLVNKYYYITMQQIMEWPKSALTWYYNCDVLPAPHTPYLSIFMQFYEKKANLWQIQQSDNVCINNLTLQGSKVLVLGNLTVTVMSG